MVTACKLYKCACSPASAAQIKYASIPCTASQVNRGAGRAQLQSFCRKAHSAGCSSMCLVVVRAHPCSGHLQFLKEIHSPISCVSPSVDPPRQPTCCQFPYLQRSACVTATPVCLRDSRKTRIKLHPPYVPTTGIATAVAERGRRRTCPSF